MSSGSATVTKPPKRRAGAKKLDSDAQREADAKNDYFFWTYTEEPHRTRRLAIIKAHPEVCGPG